MNKIFRLVWSAARGAWVVTHEHAKFGGFGGATVKAGASATALAAVLAYTPALGAPSGANALPTGAQVIAGKAAISQSGSTLTVDQSTDKAILNWQSFNIGANAAVNFNQPGASSVALNRVLGADPSAIYGSLHANGQVFLVNSSGVLFAPGAKVDVGGLVATTMNIRNEDFLAGNYRFTRESATGAVVNQGELLGRYVALLAPEVRNEGAIVAHMGTVVLAGGETVMLSITGQKLVDIKVERATIDTLIANRNLVQVDGGTVVMSAQSAKELLGKVVNTGAIEAKGITTDGGVIRLAASRSIDLGGSLSADAGTSGNGGHIAAIADLGNPDSRTLVSGTISARGGSDTGNGGLVETSASHLTIADSARVITNAPNGQIGTWLLDPYDFTIAASNGDITGSALSTALGTSNVTIQTSSGSVSCTGASCGSGSSSGNGDINVNDALTWSSAHALTLNAWRNININAPVSVNGSGALNLQFGQSGTTASPVPAAYLISAPVNLAATASFSTKYLSDGLTTSYTIIQNNAGLAAVTSNLSGNYVLGTNVAATTNPWVPIGNATTAFSGIFDGLGHTISSITLNAVNGDSIGLFGVNNGLIQNLGVTGVSISGATSVGALAGRNNGTIGNVYATGTVSANVSTGANTVGGIGGLVGTNAGGIAQSYANVTVTATTGAQSTGIGIDGGIGGLVGMHQLGTIVGSYATGSVSGITDVGGLVGYAAGSIATSYSTGAVSCPSGCGPVGGLVGALSGAATPGLLSSTFWDTGTSGQASSATDGVNSSTGLADAAMKQQASYSGFDFTNSWVIRENQSYPLLSQMLQPIFVIADNKSATYSGSAYSNFTSTIASATAVATTDYTGSVTVTPSTASPTKAGTYTLTPSGLTLANPTNQQGYLLAYVNGTLTINPATITISGNLIGSTSKVYDGTTSVTGLTASNFSLTGWSGTDGATVTKTTGTYDNANAGTGKTVTVTLASSDFTKTGSTILANYALPTSVSGAIGAITPKTVGLSASKTYDGTNSLTGSNVTLTTGVSGESLSYTGASANSKDVGSGNFISAITLANGTGGTATNYQLPTLNTTNAPVTITPKTVTLSAAKTYDGTTSLTGAVTLNTGITGESLNYSGASASSKNVADNGTNYISAITLANNTGTNPALAADYALPTLNVANAPVTINKANVTVSLAGTVSRNYDGTTVTPDLLNNLSLSGLVSGELIVPTVGGTPSVAGTYATKDAGTGKQVTGTLANWQGLAGFGAAAGDPNNYNLPTSVSGNVGKITPKPVTATLTGAISKTYDGTNTATIDLSNLTLSGLVSNEVILPGLSAQYDTKNAGTSNQVNATLSNWQGVSSSLFGWVAGDPNNYTLPASASGAVGTITPKTVTLSAAKTYDGTTSLTGAVTLNTGITGESLNYTGATASRKNVADNATNYISAITLANNTGTNPALAANYALPTLNLANAPATINKANVTVSLAGTVSRNYDGTTVTPELLNNFNLNGLVSGETILPTVGGAPSIAGTYATKDAGSGILVTGTLANWQGVAFFGAPGDPNNYNLPTTVSANIGTITPKPITATLTGTIGKTYDGTTAATIGASNFSYNTSNYVAGEGAYLSGTDWQSGTYASKNAGTGIAVSVNINPADYTAWPGTNTNLKNYSFPTTVSGNVGTITPKAVTLTAPSVTKVYNGNNTQYVDTDAANLAVLSSQLGVAGDSVAGLLERFDSQNAGSGKTVTPLAVRINDGNNGGNYSVTYVGNNASSITPRPVAVTANNVTKIGSATDPALTYTAEAQNTSTNSGLVTGETLSGALTRDPGNTDGKYAITQGTLTNANNPNYSIAYTPGTFTLFSGAVPGIGQISAVSGGLGGVSQSGSTTTITQSTPAMQLTWPSFGIPGGSTLNFAQPSASAVAMNLITSGSASSIFGSLTSNGIVFLVNPSGILFGPGASIDVGGLVASAMNVNGFTPGGTPNWSVLDANRLGFNGTGSTLHNEANLTLKAGKFWGFYGANVVSDGSISVAGGSTAPAKNDNWKNLDTLTLSSQGNIDLNSPLNLQGASRLILETGQASADGGASDYIVNAAPTLANTSSFALRQGSAGVLQEYMVVSDLAGLRTMSGNVAIGADIDASATQSNTIAQFTARDITGTFAGLGHTITGLTGTGFIGKLQGSVRDIGMVNVNSSTSFSLGVGGLVNSAADGSRISNSSASGTVYGSQAGGLVGDANGSITISNSYASSAVGASSVGIAGGLVGLADGTVTISNSHASGAVTGGDAGGLVGYTNGSVMIGNSYASGAVGGSDGSAGGLVGKAGGTVTISDSHASGTVNGRSETGGLVGYTNGSVMIGNSYASGAVGSDNGSAGGLVGDASGSATISNSYASGAVTGYGNAGGLVGYVSGSATVSSSYASGAVGSRGYGSAGGLVGYAGSATISDSYASGAVSAGRDGGYAGGLVGGVNNIDISSSYATGAITADSDRGAAGGLVGNAASAVTIKNSYASGGVSSGSSSGGLVGGAGSTTTSNTISTISNSYASGAVTASLSLFVSGAAGGLIGIVATPFAISNSYSSGAVTGSAGGLLAGDLFTSATLSISNSYATGTLKYVGSGQVLIPAVFDTGNLHITNSSVLNWLFQAPFQASYQGFDFTNVWAIDSTKGLSARPYLRGLPDFSVPSAQAQQQTQQFATVASVVSAALQSATQSSTGSSVNSLAQTAAKGLQAALTAEAQAAAPKASAAAQSSATAAEAQAITEVKSVIAAMCSSCSFSDADLARWVQGK